MQGDATPAGGGAAFVVADELAVMSDGLIGFRNGLN
jgi:hypothetical protein